MVGLEEDTTEFGKKFEGWGNAAQKAGRWFRRVEERAEAFMRKSHDSEGCRAAERHAKAAAVPPLAVTSMRRGGGKGVLPKIMKSGSGHRRPDVTMCVSSHGRKYLA